MIVNRSTSVTDKGTSTTAAESTSFVNGIGVASKYTVRSKRFGTPITGPACIRWVVFSKVASEVNSIVDDES